MTARSATEDESVLVTRFRDGDATALGELYTRHFPSVYQTVGPRAGDPDAAEDLAQAAFLRAWEQRDRLRDPRKFRPWLLATARNLAVDAHRQRRHLAPGDVAEDLPSRSPSVDTAVMEAETTDLVWRAASSLEPRQREVLELSVRQDLSTPEVATVLGVSAAHAAVLVHRSRRALGASVRALLVATRARECPGLQRLIPADRGVLTRAERATVDRHMRRCPVCRAAADELTDPSRLFAGLPLLALPQGWNTTGLHALLGHAAGAGSKAGAATGAGARHPFHAAAAVGVAAAVTAVVLLLQTHRGATPHTTAAVQPPPAAGVAGRVLVTGDDPDVHAHFGPNTVGARHLVQAAVRFVTRGRSSPRLLLVTDLRDPGGALHGDPRLGLRDSGYTFDVADAGSGLPGTLPLRSVRFTDYDAVIIASDFGGWLRQDELDILDARRADLAAFLAGGGGLVAFAERGATATPGSDPLTTHGWFGFLPFAWSSAPLSEYESSVTVTAAGAALGLQASDETRNYLHAAFTAPTGATVLVLDRAGRAIAFTMAVASPASPTGTG